MHTSYYTILLHVLLPTMYVHDNGYSYMLIATPHHCSILDLITGVLVQALILSPFHCLQFQLLVVPSLFFSMTYPLPHLIIDLLLSLPLPSSCLGAVVRWVSVTFVCPVGTVGYCYVLAYSLSSLGLGSLVFCQALIHSSILSSSSSW